MLEHKEARKKEKRNDQNEKRRPTGTQMNS